MLGEGSRPFVLNGKISIDFEEFFSRALAAKNSDARFGGLEMLGEKFDQPGIGQALPSWLTHRHRKLGVRPLRDDFFFRQRFDRYPKLPRYN
jgi:hypothetical protein